MEIVTKKVPSKAVTSKNGCVGDMNVVTVPEMVSVKLNV
jgi:hypothetical protein